MCPRCGLATARVERDLVLCGSCGAVERADDVAVPIREEWMLELLAGDDRAALGQPVARRRIVAWGIAIVACVDAGLVAGLVVAFRVRGDVNVRYIGALAALVALVGGFAVAAVAWAAGDPNSPLRDARRRRLEAAERALDASRDDD